MADMKQAGRLAMRVEGNLWVAYFAQIGTMDGAIFLGSIHLAFVQNQERKRAFMGLMDEAVGEMLQAATGAVLHWHEAVAAPEHERSGRA